MRWYQKLYEGELASKNRYSIIKDIRHHRPRFGTYVLTLPTEPYGCINIFHNLMLMQKPYKDTDYMIIGIAEGKNEAYELSRRIISDVYTSTGSFDVSGFVNKNS